MKTAFDKGGAMSGFQAKQRTLRPFSPPKVALSGLFQTSTVTREGLFRSLRRHGRAMAAI